MNLRECVRGGSQDMRPGFVIAFDFDPDTVTELKRSVPFPDREWREDTKTWWVSAEYEGVLSHLFPNFEALVHLQGRMFEGLQF